MVFGRKSRKIPFLADDEKVIKKQHVFLEKSNKPTSYSGHGISRGILMLTNKRLYFFYINNGSLLNMILRALPGYLLGVIGLELGLESLSNITDLIEFSEPAFEALIERLKGESDEIKYIGNKGSFAIPLKRIISYQKFVTRWFRIPNIFVLKKVYFRFNVACNDGTTVHYCVYSNNPKSPFNYIRIVSPSRWHKEMMKAKGESSQSSSRILQAISTKAIITTGAIVAIIAGVVLISGPLGAFTYALSSQSYSIEFNAPSIIIKPISEIWIMLFTYPILYVLIGIVIVLIIFAIIKKELSSLDAAIGGAFWIVIGIIGVNIINAYSLDKLIGPYFVMSLPSGPIEFFLTIFTPPWLYILIAFFTVQIIRFLIHKMYETPTTATMFGSSSSTFSYNSLKYYCMSCGTKHNQAACPKCGSKMKTVGY